MAGIATNISPPGPPPKEALEYFRGKGWAVGFDHRDVWKEEHAVAFTVAKAMSLDVLAAIRGSVGRALAEGRTFRDFRQTLKPELQRLGWWGRKEMVDPKTGKTSEVQLGSSRRLGIIYDTNLRMVRAAGQWQRIERTKHLLPYLLYLLGPAQRHRDEHVGWAGTLLPVDDPWWDGHNPPNGWRCVCHIRQVGRSEADGLGGERQPPPDVMTLWRNERLDRAELLPKGISPGFNYNAGKARLRAFTPPPRGGLPTSFPPGVQTPPLLRPRDLPGSTLLPLGLPPEKYAEAFLAEFGADLTRPAIWSDRAGWPIAVGADLFRDRTGKLKADKRGRGPYARILAQTLRDPDEIWWSWDQLPDKSWQLTRRYFARWQVAGQPAPATVMFEWSASGWRGLTAYPLQPERPRSQVSYIERRLRGGLLAYRRQE